MAEEESKKGRKQAKKNISTKNKEGEEMSIEDSLKKLDSILEKMEDEDTGLEETFRLYEEGLGLVKRVNASIEKVEKRIEILSDEDEI